MTECKLQGQSCSVHELIEVLISSIEAKDDYTKGHSDRVADLSEAIAKNLLLSQAQIFSIHIAGHLHDLGKLHVPDAILTKTGNLTQEEWTMVEKHPEVGAHILSKVKGFDGVVEMVRYHHERYDGKGYPYGISGQNIPLGARIIAVSDAVDAMLSKRPYRPALSKAVCIEELENGRGLQFDPQIASIAIKLLRAGALDQIVEA